MPIYLDYHATTPVDPRVLDAMLPYFTVRFGNPASRQHSFGWDAQKAVDAAREQVAGLIGASAGEIVFTSGASESNNLAIKGTACALRDRGNHLITAVTEHKSVLDTFKRLAGEGFDVTWLPVNSEGFIDLEQLRRSITDKTVLVSVMAANNEIGTVQHLAGDRRHHSRARRDLPHRRGAGGRQSAARRQGDERRSARADRAQVLRTQGRRRVVRATPQAEAPAGLSDRRRWP